MTKSISAIVPVRCLDSQIQNKNILPFANKNLLTYKISQLLSVPEISSIIVSSDSDEYLDYARSAGVQAVKRPAELASINACFSDFVKYIAGLVCDEQDRKSVV